MITHKVKIEPDDATEPARLMIDEIEITFIEPSDKFSVEVIFKAGISVDIQCRYMEAYLSDLRLESKRDVDLPEVQVQERKTILSIKGGTKDLDSVLGVFDLLQNEINSNAFKQIMSARDLLRDIVRVHQQSVQRNSEASGGAHFFTEPPRVSS